MKKIKKNSIEHFISNEKAMLDLGKALAVACNHTAIIFLKGKLGAGKTTFCRGFLRGLGLTEKVKSPTYTLVEPYQVGNKKIYHFDLYRISNSYELELIGIQEYFTPHAICLVEWPEKADNLMPTPDLYCYIKSKGEGRNFKIESLTEAGHLILERLNYVAT